MKPFVYFLVVFLAAVSLSHGQQALYSSPSSRELLWKGEMRQHAILLEAMQKPASDPNVDVTYYKLDLTVTTSPNYLRGVVTMKAKSNSGNLTAVTLDLTNVLTVDSVKTGNTKLSFLQQPATATLTIALDRGYSRGELVTMDIYYRGLPVNNSFTFASVHESTPWVYTFSEPYGARNWWPCKDHPSDKADSVDIWATVDSTLKVGSNGKLIAIVNNGDGTKTYRWAERYPISTYLVSLAITNYAEFTNWFKYSPTDSMPVLNYVLPGYLSNAQANLPKAVDMLSIYSNAFGLYPFIKEKYGHAQWDPTMGGMEHQTMTSLSSFGEYLVAHELAHMWFGDMITCANWPNIWMNEGFAEYCVAVYYEGKYGTSGYWNHMNSRMAYAKNAGYSVYRRDSTALFDGNSVYCKGASVLHMLRHVLGDSVFFRSLRTYAQDSRLRFSVATTEDFRQVCETVSGQDLGYFFNEWIYGEKYPLYHYSWDVTPDSNAGYLVNLNLLQLSGTTNPVFFTMPIDVKLKAGAWDTTVVLFNNSQSQLFHVYASHQPDTVALDPDNWILHDVQVTPFDKPFIVVDTKPTFLVTNDAILRCDTTFLVRNIGFAPDSLTTSISVDPENAPPDSAIAVFPLSFSLAGGDSQKVTFSIQPRLIPPGYYDVFVVINSRFGQQPRFSKLMRFEKNATGVSETPGLPREFSLQQNYPNPFNPSTTIKYELPKASMVRLSVYDILGREVSVLVNERKNAGAYEAKFEGTGLSSGVYFYRLTAGDFVQTRKLLLMK